MRSRYACHLLLILSLTAFVGCAPRARGARGAAASDRAAASAPPPPAVTATAGGVETSAPVAGPASAPPLPPPRGRRRLPLGRKSSAAALYFLNPTSGWVLLNGALYRTNNGGKGWDKLNGTPSRNYTKIIFSTGTRGLILRDDWNTEKRSNVVLSTEDGGASWREVLEMPTPIYTMALVSERAGYVSGRWQPIRYTGDGGKTWKTLGGTEGLNYLFFISEKEGWGYGGAIWHTEDGGETWTRVVPFEAVADLWDAKFIDESNGWILGGRRQLWHTTDGRTWRQITTLPASQSEVASFDFISYDEGWVASEDGTVIHTTDEGATWQVVAKLGESLKEVKFIDRSNGWAVSGQDKLYRTSDGGATWGVVRLRP